MKYKLEMSQCRKYPHLPGKKKKKKTKKCPLKITRLHKDLASKDCVWTLTN